MRVIAGIARSMPLKAAEGDNTRPTTARIKETLFKMLQTDIEYLVLQKHGLVKSQYPYHALHNNGNDLS